MFFTCVIFLTHEHSALLALFGTHQLIANVSWVLSVTHLCIPPSTFHIVVLNSVFLLDWYSQEE